MDTPCNTSEKEVDELRRELEQQVERADSAWKNTQAIDKERMRLGLENEELKRLLLAERRLTNGLIVENKELLAERDALRTGLLAAVHEGVVENAEWAQLILDAAKGEG